MLELTALTLLAVFMIGVLFDVNPIQLLAQLTQIPIFQVLFLGTVCYSALRYIVSQNKEEQ